jgi:hypothetical protein
VHLEIRVATESFGMKHGRDANARRALRRERKSSKIRSPAISARMTRYAFSEIMVPVAVP